jgi:hypothetical protein
MRAIEDIDSVGEYFVRLATSLVDGCREELLESRSRYFQVRQPGSKPRISSFAKPSGGLGERAARERPLQLRIRDECPIGARKPVLYGVSELPASAKQQLAADLARRHSFKLLTQF